MVEAIGPELDSEIGSCKEGSNRIGQGPVSAFNRAILERSFGASGSNFVTFESEEVSDIVIVVEFAALVQVYILVLAGFARAVLG